MKLAMIGYASLFFCMSAFSQVATKLPAKKSPPSARTATPAKAQSTPKAKARSTRSDTPAVTKSVKVTARNDQSGMIQKSPKAIFLIKRAKMDADIGEPVLYPFERQLSNLYYDLPGGVIRNE